MSIGIVKTKYGLVKGAELEGIYSGITTFRGIPFAKPPVGELRWRAPVDPAPWDGVKECVSNAPICIQPTAGSLDSEPWASDFYYMGNMPQSEDCLYLNVTTGAQDASEKRPVYVWFHGGGSDHGYTYEIEFDPSELARKGVVVVSVAQRLSMFGYLALPQLDAEQGGKSGNYILLDDMKALEWIIENIEAFGGDPDTITVGGQSAGTGKSSTLAYTELARGHVKRIINQSGLKWGSSYSTREEAEEQCAEYLRKIGIDPTLPVEELRKIDGRAFLPPEGQQLRIPGPLICDGENIPDIDFADTVDRYIGECDYLSGTNLGETRMNVFDINGGYGYRTAEEFYTGAKELLGDLYDKYDFENLVKVTDETADRESRRLASLGLTNSDRLGGLVYGRRFGEYRAEKKSGKKAFSYIFSRVSPTRPEDEGTIRDPKRLMSWHSNELWYCFASLRDGIPPARPWEKVDFELADTMSSYWANFIKTGDPNGEGLPVWPEADESHGFIELGSEVVGYTDLGKLDELISEFTERKCSLPR